MSSKANQFIQEFQEKTAKNRGVAFDSSAILPLAEEVPDVLLNQILVSPLLRITPVVFKELQGLQISHPALRPIVNKIVLLKKVGTSNPSDVLMHELSYAPLVPLLPRKAAHELMVTNSDSYVNQGIEIFEKGQALIKTRRTTDAAKLMKSEIQTLRKMVDRFGQLATQRLIERATKVKLDLGDFDFDKYSIVVQAETRRVLSEIDAAVSVAAGNIERVKVALNQFKKKTYSADVRHMAEVLAMNLENITADSDQLFLLEFHSRTG